MVPCAAGLHQPLHFPSLLQIFLSLVDRPGVGFGGLAHFLLLIILGNIDSVISGFRLLVVKTYAPAQATYLLILECDNIHVVFVIADIMEETLADRGS